MPRTSRRAILAVIAGAVGAAVGIAGVGHVYLREWRRGAAWFVLVVGSMLFLGALFVDPATTDPSALGPASVPLTVTLPVAVLLVLSMVDAYLVASRSAESDGDEAAPACPNCGKELDAELSFCPWCTTRLASSDDAEATSR